MKIIINTDSNISGDEELRTFVGTKIATAFERFGDFLTRIEIKLSDEDGSKNSINDKRCVLEVRPKGMQPIVVTAIGDSIEKTVDDAIDKMKSIIETARGKLQSY